MIEGLLGLVAMMALCCLRVPISFAMAAVGIVGYATSALVRLAGDYLMQWRVRELALGGGR